VRSIQKNLLIYEVGIPPHVTQCDIGPHKCRLPGKRHPKQSEQNVTDDRRTDRSRYRLYV